MSDLKSLTADIVSAMVANNKVGADDLPALIKSIYDTLGNLGAAPVEPEKTVEPAVTVRKSLADPNKIISLIDGKPYSMLRRHLAKNGYTPETYRATFGLKPDYPMVAPAYAASRSELAKTIGLGRKPREVEAEPAPEPAKPARKPRAKSADAVLPLSDPKPARKPRKTLKAALGEAKEHLGG